MHTNSDIDRFTEHIANSNFRMGFVKVCGCHKGVIREFFAQNNLFSAFANKYKKQARGARSLGKFPIYSNKKKSEKLILTLKV